MARVHEDLRGSMVELRRMHRFHDRDIVHNRREMRQKGRKLRPALAESPELVWRAEKFRYALNEREPLSLDQVLGAWLPVEPVQRRLAIEKIQLRRAARHEQKDDVLGLRRKMRSLRCQGLRE